VAPRAVRREARDETVRFSVIDGKIETVSTILYRCARDLAKTNPRAAAAARELADKQRAKEGPVPAWVVAVAKLTHPSRSPVVGCRPRPRGYRARRTRTRTSRARSPGRQQSGDDPEHDDDVADLRAVAA
jgi:hypothetical protein